MPYCPEGWMPRPLFSLTHWKIWEEPSSQAHKKPGAQQREKILALAASGKTNSEIADALGCTRENVRKHKIRAQKLGAKC